MDRWVLIQAPLNAGWLWQQQAGVWGGLGGRFTAATPTIPPPHPIPHTHTHTHTLQTLKTLVCVAGGSELVETDMR